MACDVSKFSDYYCPTTGGPIRTEKGIVKPLDAAVLAPWVEVTFKGGNKITVGNKSSPDSKNRAVIKSFQYGTSNGQGCEIEIIDQEGGSVAKFLEKLNKSLKNAPNDYAMAVDFGWIMQSCTGEITTKKASESGEGGALTFLPGKMTSRYENGLIKFTITGQDLMTRVAENKIYKIYGEEKGGEIPLKEAIKRILSENDPKIESIQYKRKGANGVLPDWGFKGEAEGPKNVWKTNGMDAFSAIRQWINITTTDADKGIVIVWNCAAKTPEVVFWEAPPDVKPCVNNIGTFLVNAGNCSPVISFTPTAEWQIVLKAGDTGGGPSSAKTTVTKKIKKDEERVTDTDGGSSRRAAGGAAGYESVYAPEEAGKKLAEAAVAHDLAGAYFDFVTNGSINAELTIQGNPDFVHPLTLTSSFVSIIYINPFYISGENCDWLIEPEANPVWSNKNWLIMGVDHQIRDASYTTTLKLRLFAPNSDLPSDQGLGGDGPRSLTSNA